MATRAQVFEPPWQLPEPKSDQAHKGDATCECQVDVKSLSARLRRAATEV